MKFASILSVIGSSSLLLSVPAFAEEGKAGLPQMDASFFPGEIFWLAISFPLLYGLMRYVALPMVQQTQAKRNTILSADLAVAKESGQKVEALMTDYEKALATARQTAHAAVTEIVAESGRETSVRMSARQHELNEQINAAEKKIAVARDAALKEAQGVVDDLANTIVAQVTQSSSATGA